MSWSINCPKWVRKVECLTLFGVSPERTALLTTRALGRSHRLFVVRVRDLLMPVKLINKYTHVMNAKTTQSLKGQTKRNII